MKSGGHIPALNSIALLNLTESIFQLFERDAVELSLDSALGKFVPSTSAVVVCVIRADPVIATKQHFKLVGRVEESTLFVDIIWFGVHRERLSSTVESNAVQQIGTRYIQMHKSIRLSTTSFPQIIQELLQSPQPFH